MTTARRHHVTQFDAGELRVPQMFVGHSLGYRRDSHIDRSVGAVHNGFGTSELDAGDRSTPTFTPSRS